MFLLTDTQPKLLAGGTGLSLERNEPASSLLLDDLRSDKGMAWVPASMWFTYLRLDVPAGQLDYDLAVSTHKGEVPQLADTGVDATEVRASHPAAPRPCAVWPLVAALRRGAADVRSCSPLSLGAVGARRGGVTCGGQSLLGSRCGRRRRDDARRSVTAIADTASARRRRRVCSGPAS